MARAGLHRSASAVDLMIAATAAHHGLTVLHDDAASSAAGPPGPAAFPPERQERILAMVMAGITRAKHLNPGRRHRTYPRVVKRARRNSYRVKRPGGHGTRHPGPATISLVNLRQVTRAA